MSREKTLKGGVCPKAIKTVLKEPYQPHYEEDTALFYTQKQKERQVKPMNKLMKVSYYDPKSEVHLTSYADTVVYGGGNKLTAIHLGGYPEQVRALSDAIYGGSIDVESETQTLRLRSSEKRYRRQTSHDGLYAEATLLIKDDDQEAKADENEEQSQVSQPKKVYLFTERGNRKALFEEIDSKTAVPLIAEFQDYFLMELQERGILTPLTVLSASPPFDAWVLASRQDDKPLIDIINDGLQSGKISIPGAQASDNFDDVITVSQYLKRFGVTVANRIKNLFQPLFDPATDTLSPELLTVNEFFKRKTRNKLYDAQLAVAEALKRQLDRGSSAFLIAECGSGKTKIGSAALFAHQHGAKCFNVVLCPSHITEKWVREIEETIPNAFAGTIHSPEELDRFYSAYVRGTKSAYAIISKERARDGYMKQPAVVRSKFKRAFVCPDCGKVITMKIVEGASSYRVNANSQFFLRETDKNHKCEHCKTPLWTAINPNRQSYWVKVAGHGFVPHNEADRPFTVGAYRRIALSTYIKNTFKGKLDGLILDELHQYSNQSGQGDAMAELVGVAKKTIGMTATLVNGYSKGIFYLLFRMAAPLILKDGKEFRKPLEFTTEYGVTETVYEIEDGEYNSNRRTVKHKKQEKQLPGVSPLVYSRFLMESAAFLSLADMGKQLPEYEEIPVPLNMKPEVAAEYSRIEGVLRQILRNDRKLAQKILSAYLGILTVYPDQPYGHNPIVKPINGEPLVEPKDTSDFSELHEKDLKLLEIVQAKVARHQRVLVYTSWVRIDTREKLKKLLTERGIKTEILPATVSPCKREAWLAKSVRNGVQVLITNPSIVETGLDLNDFTTLIYYNIAYNLFSLRQSSRRSWRINQTAPRIEVYFLYYRNTMQHRAMRLMASKLSVASIIEGNISDEGLAAMSECADMTTLLAKELTLGIRNEVDDIAEIFRKMAILKPEGETALPIVELPKPYKQAVLMVAEQLSLFDLAA
ncbi:hypothetical protein FACS1894208_01850 [Clostridia bacterium]|nr:hypothetical protein FACS1894208_01850 [Clostridia bacterium]